VGEKAAGRAKPRRHSKRMLRVWAWVAGAVAFFSPWTVLGLSPRPPASEAAGPTQRRVIIVRKITRRVIIREAPKDRPVRYVYAPATSSVSGSAPVTSTGGSGTPR